MGKTHKKKVTLLAPESLGSRLTVSKLQPLADAGADMYMLLSEIKPEIKNINILHSLLSKIKPEIKNMNIALNTTNRKRNRDSATNSKNVIPTNKHDIDYMLKSSDEIATLAHNGQKRGCSDEDYITHLRRVSNRLIDPDQKTTALLYDIIESNKSFGSFIFLRKNFPKNIVDAIVALTKNKCNETYLQYLIRVKANPLAKAVKLAELEDNMEGLYKQNNLYSKYELACYFLQA